VEPGAQTAPPSLAPSRPPSSPLPTVESFAASSVAACASTHASRIPASAGAPFPDGPLHAASTRPENIKTEIRRTARPLTMFPLTTDAPRPARRRALINSYRKIPSAWARNGLPLRSLAVRVTEARFSSSDAHVPTLMRGGARAHHHAGEVDALPRGGPGCLLVRVRAGSDDVIRWRVVARPSVAQRSKQRVRNDGDTARDQKSPERAWARGGASRGSEVSLGPDRLHLALPASSGRPGWSLAAREARRKRQLLDFLWIDGASERLGYTSVWASPIHRSGHPEYPSVWARRSVVRSARITGPATLERHRLPA
jgi:hypothetical protein